MPPSKKKTYIEKYYSLTEQEMQEIINKAKNGSSAAQLQLLEIFGNFLAKYVTCLYYGKYSLNDYDIRRFVALFVKDNHTRIYLVRNKLNPQGVKIAHIKVDEPWTANLCFCGKNKDDLFITASKAIYILHMNVKGVE